MNILAHLYLSGKNEDVMFGNFIGDFVKGNQISKYPPEVARGIQLHRSIDYFTDTHLLVKKVNKIFREKYGKHSGIVTDIVFDYYLSNNWEKYSMLNIDTFIKSCYDTLNRNLYRFPNKTKDFYPFMVINNWLKLYRSKEGIRKVLRGMSKRTSVPAAFDFAIEQMDNHNQTIEDLFLEFFPELIAHANKNYQVGIVLPTN